MHSTSDINRVDCEPLTANQDLLVTAEDDCCCGPPPPPATDNDEAEDPLDQESVASDSEGPRFNRDLVPQPPRRCLNAYQEYRKACKCTDKLWKDMTAEERQPFIQKANENKKRYREHWLEYEKGMRIAKKPSGIDILVIAPPAPALCSFDYFCMAKSQCAIPTERLKVYWQIMSPPERGPYESMAIRDELRYQLQQKCFILLMERR